MPLLDVVSADGTRIRCWRNRDDRTGIPVLISNGLGTPPTSWPAIIRGDGPFRVVTWYYRGTGGSARPADPVRVRVRDHVDDALALLDAEGMDQALVVCWSIGVSVGFELAERHPSRVAGLLAVAGVPGGAFGSFFGPLQVPKRLRHPLGVAVARSLRAVGPVLTRLARSLPLNRVTATVINHTGFVLPAARPEVLLPALAEFRQHDFRWYFDLALAASEHRPMDLSFVRCPTTLVAGRWDLLTSMWDMLAAADRIPHSRVHVLPGSHFLPLEYPEEIGGFFRELAARTELGRGGATDTATE